MDCLLPCVLTAEVFARFAVWSAPRLSLPRGDEYDDCPPRTVVLQDPKRP